MDFSRESMVRDIEAVVDVACPGPFVMQTWAWFAIPALAYVAAHPGRVRALVLLNGILRGSDMSDGWKTLIRLARENWDDAVPFIARSNDASYDSTSTLEQYQESFRRHTDKDTYLQFAAMMETWDAGDIAPLVEAPALVCHYQESTFVSRDAARRLVTALPNSTFASVSTTDVAGSRIEHVRVAVQDFLRTALGRPGPADTAPARPPRSGTGVILFADIVDSTALTAQIGNAAFRDRSRQVEDALRAAIRATGGTPVEGRTLGDGVLGDFNSASGAIGAAVACTDAASRLELALHVGIHAGAVIREAGNVHGIAVSMASRISALTGPNEILVSSTVRDLARASTDVTFEDRGEHALKGIAEPQRVFAVRAAGAG
jgi:class 3 adenylate cyclase